VKLAIDMHRSSYFTDRPLSSIPIAGESASRGWLTLDQWAYPIGDGKAVAGFELTKIAQPVYDLMMKGREQHVLYSTDADNLAFFVAMDKFNERLTEWGDYWQAIFSKCKSTVGPCSAPGLIISKFRALNLGKCL
jgi:hypothetical protein